MPLSARGPRAEPSMGRPVSRLRQRQWPGNLKLEPAGYRSSRRGHAGHARQRCEEAGAAGSIVGTQHARHRAVMARVLSPCSGRDGDGTKLTASLSERACLKAESSILKVQYDGCCQSARQRPPRNEL